MKQATKRGFLMGAATVGAGAAVYIGFIDRDEGEDDDVAGTDGYRDDRRDSGSGDGGGGEAERTTTDRREVSQWRKTYGNDDFRTFLWGVTPTSDGGYLAAGSQDSTDTIQDGLVLKVDSEGEEEWLETFSGPEYDWLNTAVETDDGYVGVGTRTTEVTEPGEAWLLGVETDGDRDWEQTFREERVTYGWSMALTEDGGYLLVGRTAMDPSASDWQPIVIKTDAEGDPKWRRTYLTDDAIGGRFQGAVPTDDGYLITGSVVESEGDQSRGYAMEIDADGEEQWRQTYDEGLLGRVTAVDRGYVATGFQYGPEGREGWLLGVGRDGAEQWSQTYTRGTDASVLDVAPADGLRDGGGGYLAGGWYRKESDDNQIGWLLEVSQSGQMLRETAWDDVGASSISGVEAVGDGAYVIAGWADEDGRDSDEQRTMGRMAVTTDFDI